MGSGYSPELSRNLYVSPSPQPAMKPLKYPSSSAVNGALPPCHTTSTDLSSRAQTRNRVPPGTTSAPAGNLVDTIRAILLKLYRDGNSGYTSPEKVKSFQVSGVARA